MRIDCFKCQFFRVTWDQMNPRGCTAYGFKTRQLPSVLVKQSSGMECMKFKAKQMGEQQ